MKSDLIRRYIKMLAGEAGYPGAVNLPMIADIHVMCVHLYSLDIHGFCVHLYSISYPFGASKFLRGPVVKVGHVEIDCTDGILIRSLCCLRTEPSLASYVRAVYDDVVTTVRNAAPTASADVSDEDTSTTCSDNKSRDSVTSSTSSSYFEAVIVYNFCQLRT